MPPHPCCVLLSVQLDRLIEVQPSQAQVLNSQLPPGFMYVPAACLPANYQAALQLTSSAADAKLPQAPLVLPPLPASNLAHVDETSTGGEAAALQQQSADGVVTVPGANSHQADGIRAASAGAAGPPDGAAPRNTPAASIKTDEDYEPLAALAGSRARGPRDKTPRRPRTSEMTRPGARPGKRGKRG